MIENRTELLHALFVTAVEGGINYWSQCTDYRWATDEDGRKEDFEGFSVVLYPAAGCKSWGLLFSDGNDREPLTVNKEVMERGLVRLGEWAFTDTRNGVGAPVGTATGEWSTWPRRLKNKYWTQFMLGVQLEKFADLDFDAGLADAIVQLGLFNELVYS